MAIAAQNILVGANNLIWHYVADMHITDVNNGEQFIQLEVFILVPEEAYAMFVLNEPLAINKWMVLLIPECDEEEDEDIELIFQTYAFETSMDCMKIPPHSAMVWCRKAMTNKKNTTIMTSRPLSCIVSNIRHIANSGMSF